MAKDICNPRMTAACNETLTEGVGQSGCKEWTACLPFGGVLTSKGGCINYEPGQNPPSDGVYSKIIIVDGCIVSAELADIPIYTSAPCAPVPAPCDCDGSGTLPDPSPTAGNLFRYDASGRPLVRLSVMQGDGISVTGAGTATDPLVITNTMAAQTKDFFRSGNAAIILTGTGTAADPYTYTHADHLEGQFAGFGFDRQGHLISYTPPSTAGTINGILAGDGIAVATNTSTGIATVSLADPINIITDSFLFGGYTVEYVRNRLIRITQTIHAPAGTYRLGNYDVTVTDLGSIADVVYIPPIPSDPGIVTAAASKQFVPVTDDNQRQMNIATARDSGFRISYISTNIPADIVLFVDGMVLPGLSIAGHHFEATTPAIYAEGNHTIVIQSDTGFTAAGILTVTLSVVS